MQCPGLKINQINYKIFPSCAQTLWHWLVKKIQTSICNSLMMSSMVANSFSSLADSTTFSDVNCCGHSCCKHFVNQSATEVQTEADHKRNLFGRYNEHTGHIYFRGPPVVIRLFFVWYCQSTKVKVTLWSVDLIEGLNCWNMLWKS